MDFADDKCRAAYEANIGKIIADINDTVNDLFNEPMCCGYGEDGELTFCRYDSRAI